MNLILYLFMNKLVQPIEPFMSERVQLIPNPIYSCLNVFNLYSFMNKVVQPIPNPFHLHYQQFIIVR